MCVFVRSLVHNLVRPKTTTVPFAPNDVWSMFGLCLYVLKFLTDCSYDVRKGEEEGMHWYDTYSLGGRAFFSGKDDLRGKQVNPRRVFSQVKTTFMAN